MASKHPLEYQMKNSKEIDISKIDRRSDPSYFIKPGSEINSGLGLMPQAKGTGAQEEAEKSVEQEKKKRGR